MTLFLPNLIIILNNFRPIDYFILYTYYSVLFNVRVESEPRIKIGICTYNIYVLQHIDTIHLPIS